MVRVTYCGLLGVGKLPSMNLKLVGLIVANIVAILLTRDAPPGYQAVRDCCKTAYSRPN